MTVSALKAVDSPAPVTLAPEQSPQVDDPSVRLIARLREAQAAVGGAPSASAKLYRLEPADPKYPSGRWLRSYVADPAWFDGLEQTIAQEYGGGKYKVVVEVKQDQGRPQYFNLAVAIDPDEYPPKMAPAAAAQAAPPPAPEVTRADLQDLEQRIVTALARALEARPAAPAPAPAANTIDLSTLLQMKEEHMRDVITLVKEQRTATQSAPVAAGDPLEVLKRAMEMRKMVDDLVPAAAAKERSPAAQFGERVAEKFFERLGDKVIDAIGKHVEKHGVDGEQKPAPAQPAPAEAKSEPKPRRIQLSPKAVEAVRKAKPQ